MDVELRTVKFTVEGKDFDAVLSIPKAHKPEYGVVLTHGAGGSLESGELPPLASYLAEHGILCLRFTCRGLNLKYRIRIYQQILEQFLSMEEFKLKGIFLGGRSMGSRAAVGVANGSQDSQQRQYILGVICLAYPLIGSNKGDVRDEPLFGLPLPCIFISGNRDPMCPTKRLNKTLKKMKRENTVCWLSDVAHQFVIKGKQGETIDTICHQVKNWCFRFFKVTDSLQEQAIGHPIQTHDLDREETIDKLTIADICNNQDKTKKMRTKSAIKRKAKNATKKQGSVSEDPNPKLSPKRVKVT